MIAELGHLGLVIALVLAVLQAVGPLAGAARGHRAWMAAAPSLAQGQALFVVLAFAALTWLHVDNDFSVLVVAQHSHTQLPLLYRVAAVWGGHEGSMLLWVLMLSVWSVAVTRFGRRLPLAVVARVLGVLGAVAVGFHAFLLFTSNPFARLVPAPPQGRDLNPLLQDPGMAIHPPLLYMGYVGFSVAFAFALAALLAGRLDAGWARWSRPWTTAAWAFLTLGIAVGSLWAYYELGWGGWWFWDPVENASFMPWLLGTALMHSLAVTEKRGVLRHWTVLLAIGAFSMSLLGTFLVRSGVLSSVHAFASDPRRGLFILGFLVVVVGGSLALFAWRSGTSGLSGPSGQAGLVGGAGETVLPFSALSRESLLLANNLLLSVAAAAVMLGTLYPLALDALGLGKISVGPPYFEAVFAPLMAPAVALMAIGPLMRWGAAPWRPLWSRLRWALAAAALAVVAVALVTGRLAPWQGVGVALATWVASAAVLACRDQVRGGWRRVPRAWRGMALAHVGVAVFIAGVVGVKGFELERQVRLRVGEVATLGELQFRLAGVVEQDGPNYRALRAEVVVADAAGVERGRLYPEKRLYLSSRGMPMTEAAIAPGLFGDLYVALGDLLGDDAFMLRLQRKPLVGWIWGGCVLMALGGALAASDRRYWLRRAAGAAALALVAVTASAADVAPVPPVPPVALEREAALEARVQRLAEGLRCLVCQNQTIADSHAGLAIDLKNQIREQVQQGRSDDEVTAYMVTRFGDFILYRPPVKATTWALWFGPPVLLLAGLGALVRRLRVGAHDPVATTPALDRLDAGRAQALLADDDGGGR